MPSVKIPPMGESITSGILAKWHVADGARVTKGQPIYDLETDKITSEGTADCDGTIRFSVNAGEEVKIGQVIAEITPGADAEAAPKAAAPEPKARADAPAAQPKAEAPAKAPAPGTPIAPASAPAPAATYPSSSTAGPAARHLAAELGKDLSSVHGSGKGGRVTKADLLASGPGSAPTPAPMPAPQPAKAPSAPDASAQPRTTRRKITPIRRKIADTLVMAKNQTAMLTTFNECDMSAVMALRQKHQDAFVKRHNVKLGFMSFFVKATVQALREVPAVNTQLHGDEIVQNHFYDIGIAVSTPKGLMVPVLRDCDRLSMADIEKQLIEYATKAREGKISLDDLQGGVFTITNGGVFGSMMSTPIINPPQAGILGLHAIKERPIVVDGQIVARPMMYLAHSYDHRLIDGREAVTFLVKIKEMIEDPTRLLLDA